MKRFACMALTAVTLAGCARLTGANPPAMPSASSVSPTPSASPEGAISPTPLTSAAPSPAAQPPLAVMVDLLSDSATYTISLVDRDGNLAVQLHPQQRTPIASPAGKPVTLPYVSTSLNHLYYLDGDSILRAWSPTAGGTAVQPAPLTVGAGMEAAFAVSSDDSEIAVSVLDFNRAPVHVTVYTDALSGGNRHVIFQSDSDYVWPVAWHSGWLVLAHAYGPFEDDIFKAAPGIDNPYGAISYHVIDPVTAAREFLMGSCTVSGPLSPAGSGCIQGGSIDWQGNSTPWSTHDWGSVSSAAALSPDGQWMAATPPDNPNVIAIYSTNGNIWTFLKGSGGRDWAGWLDDQVIISGSYLDGGWEPEVNNVVRGGVEHFVPIHGFFAAIFPTNLV